ncbi:hypothetical protein [Streptomyces sp. NPDC001678]|uniref:hypothetical protein n=1 Tax=Streptomyces sp. NPDC001678 TaxID=3364599 RepID=UPI0036B332BB
MTLRPHARAPAATSRFGAGFKTGGPEGGSRAAFEELSGRDVTFVQEPQPRPWGLSAALRDHSGTVHETLQPHHQRGDA